MGIYKTKRYEKGVWVEGMQPDERGAWQNYSDLVIEIRSDGYEDVVPSAEPPSPGTEVSWSGPDGNGNITFGDGGKEFTGWCQGPTEQEPVGYWGQLTGWYG
jgi:hypothetical protein